MDDDFIVTVYVVIAETLRARHPCTGPCRWRNFRRRPAPAFRCVHPVEACPACIADRRAGAQKQIASDHDDVSLHSAREIRRASEHQEVRRHQAVAWQHEILAARAEGVRLRRGRANDRRDSLGTWLAQDYLLRTSK